MCDIREVLKYQPLKDTGPTLDIGGMGTFLGAFFLRAFCLLAPPKQMSFLTISNKNIFLKTEGTRLWV